MKPMKRAITLPLALALLACQPKAAPADQPAPEAPPLAENACGARKLASWIGKADTPAARSEIGRVSGAGSIRWLTPGMVVTMDYRPDRLNAHIDERGRYARFDCS